MGCRGGGESVCTHHVPATEQTLFSVLCLSESCHQPREDGTVTIPTSQMRRMEKDDRESKELAQPSQSQEGTESAFTLQNSLLFDHILWSI